MRQRSGFHLGSILGTTISVEVGFLILTGLFVLLDLERRVPPREALLWIPVLFLSILLHELGHAAMIGMFGFGRSQIVLSSYGGFTLNRRQARPWQDLLISVAGPMTSFALAGAALFAPILLSFARNDAMMQIFLPKLLQANLVWGIFNLLPILPLDGGQAFRSFMMLFATPRGATVGAMVVSLLSGAGLLVWALFSGQFFIAIVAGFLLMQNVQTWRIIRTTRPPGSEPEEPPEEPPREP